jgi:thioredoxin-like negative regulator of GroEL
MLAAGGEGEYEFAEVNIDEDPELQARYALKIPVITINGREAFVYRLSPAEFKEQIRAASLE